MEMWEREYEHTAQLEAEEEKALEQTPVCDMCGEHVGFEYYYDFDGMIVCDDCRWKCRKSC